MAEQDGKIVIGIEGDASGVNKALDDVEKKGKKTATSVGDAFKAVAGAVAGAQIIGAFKSAVDQANRLEASLNRVESAARSFGQSTAKAKDAAMTLAKDGFLSLNQSASALSNLMSTGLNVDQSKKFIEAAKDISAFGNTVGDAASAVESGIKGIITGSAELVENLSPAMKTLSMRFTENKNKIGEAKAVQALYNDVLKLGTRYAGDAARYLDTAAAAQKRFEGATDAAAAAIGKSLQPAFKAIFSGLESLVTSFTKWFESLKGGQQLILLLTVALTSLVPVVASLVPLLGALAFNPVTLGIMAFVAAIGAATFAMAGMRREMSQGAALLDEQKRLQALVDELKKTKSGSQELADAQAQLEKATQKLNERFGETLKILGAENAEYEKKLELIRRIESAQGRLGGQEKIQGLSDQELAQAIVTARAKGGGNRQGIRAGRVTFGATTPEQRAAAAATAGGQYGFEGDQGSVVFDSAETSGGFELAALLAEQKRRKELTPSQRSAGGPASPEFRFIKNRDEFRKIQKEYETYIAGEAKKAGLFTYDKKGNITNYSQALGMASVQGAGAEATARYGADVERIRQELRGITAEYIESRFDAEDAALKKQHKDQIANIYERANLEGWEKEKTEKELEKVREASIRKEAALRLQTYAETMQAAGATAQGFAQVMRATSAGGGLSGMGALSGGIGGLFGKDSSTGKALGSIGGISAGAGVVVSTLSDLFGKSDEERRREAEAQARRDEEAKALLELQANYQKNMLALQEAQAKLPFENLTRNLRLIDINAQQQRLSGVDEATLERQRMTARQSAIQSVLQSQSGVIAQDALFSDVQATPEGLTQFLSERAAQAVAVGQFMALVNILADPSMSINRLKMVVSQLESYRGKVPDQLFDSISSATSAINSLGISGGVADATLAKLRDFNVFGSTPFAARAQSVISAIAPVAGAAGSLVSEITRDTGTAENLLSVLEQSLQTQLDIKKSTKATADNTARLTQMRETTILDLAGGGLRGFGSFFRGAFNSIDSVLNPRMPAISTPSAISNSLNIASMTRSWQERTADGIEQLVKIQNEALSLLAEIAINSNRAGDVGGSMSEAELLNIMAKVRSRLV